MTAVFLVANIGAAIIATLAFIAFINGVLSWTCLLIGYDDVTLEYILGMNVTLMRLRDYLELCSDREYFGLYCFLSTFLNSRMDILSLCLVNGR